MCQQQVSNFGVHLKLWSCSALNFIALHVEELQASSGLPAGKVISHAKASQSNYGDIRGETKTMLVLHVHTCTSLPDTSYWSVFRSAY